MDLLIAIFSLLSFSLIVILLALLQEERHKLSLVVRELRNTIGDHELRLHKIENPRLWGISKPQSKLINRAGLKVVGREN